jgi:secreted trypsin-like serine protease
VVTNPNATVDLEGYFITEVYAQRTDGTTAAGQGDSGGPVYAQTSNPYEIVAKGIISAGDGASPVPCAGDASNGRECFSSIYWISINNALSDFGATLNTG